VAPQANAYETVQLKADRRLSLWNKLDVVGLLAAITISMQVYTSRMSLASHEWYLRRCVF
jgi:hypothetical protein